MRTCTVHVRAHCTHRGPARRSSLSRYPCCPQDSAAEIDRARSVQVRRGHSRRWPVVAAPGRPAGRGSL
uniref:Uncharacterized protein n=1 Tax=Setaria italica TaxID=4555 RepID=K3XU72_SETIT